MRLRTLALAAASLGASVAIAPAMASPITYEISGTGVDMSHDLTADITYAPVGGGGFTGDSWIGPMSLSVKNRVTDVTTTQTVYCSDIFHNYQSGSVYNLGLLSDTVSLQVAANVDALLSNVTVTDAIEGAALQAAIWKVENDPGNYDIEHGIFSISPDGITGDNAEYQAFIAQTNAYLSNISSGAWHARNGTKVQQYEAVPARRTGQNLAFLAASPVNAPEPASLALLGGGLVVLAGLRRRRPRPAEI